jgi:MerR family transcriptional regulator, heat shock protein HspR
MSDRHRPVYMIGVAAELCKVHPQTLRQYERLGLVVPSRVGSKNRLYSETDIERVRQIQRLTQELGVNLAGVEVILRLLEDMDSMKEEFELKFTEYIKEVESRLQAYMANSNAPIRTDAPAFPIPIVEVHRKTDL